MEKLQASIYIALCIWLIVSILCNILVTRYYKRSNVYLSKKESVYGIFARFLTIYLITGLIFVMLASGNGNKTGKEYIGWVTSKEVFRKSTGGGRISNALNAYSLKMDVISVDSLGKGPLEAHGLQKDIVVIEERPDIMNIIYEKSNYTLLEYKNSVTGEISYIIKN